MLKGGYEMSEGEGTLSGCEAARQVLAMVGVVGDYLAAAELLFDGDDAGRPGIGRCRADCASRFHRLDLLDGRSHDFG